MVDNDHQQQLADRIANACFQMYEKTLLAKNKLADNEWTNMAAIVALDPSIYSS